MTNNFLRRDYQDPSEPQKGGAQDIIFENKSLPDMIAGLKAAQSELTDFSSDHIKEEAGDGKQALRDKDRAQAKSIGELLRLQLDEYVHKVKNERLRLERTKTYLEESQKKINERLGRVQHVADEIERAKKNIEVIESELSFAQNQNTDIFEQMKDKLNQLKDNNEQ